MVSPGARPGGKKRTAPKPRELLETPDIGTFEVTALVLNGALTKIGGSDVVPPARIANWLSALKPTSSNPMPLVPVGSGRTETVELLLNGAAIPAA